MPDSVWLGGWGIPPARSETALTEAGVRARVLPPTTDTLEAALNSPAGTPLGGWSLGAHLLLAAITRRDPRTAGRRITLVAPFRAFPAEAGTGGRAPLTAVRHLRRMMRRDPLAALADFQTRAGIAAPPPASLPYSAEELDAGFPALENTAPIPAPDASDTLVLLAGETDALTDYRVAAAGLPGLRLLPGAGHDLRDFIPALRELAPGGFSLG